MKKSATTSKLVTVQSTQKRSISPESAQKLIYRESPIRKAMAMDKSSFITKIGDERVSCSIDILVKSIKLMERS